MTKIPSNRMLAVSQSIFDRLLFAYPQKHREEYGAAMAQLFRDQSRDAWNESRNFGLAKLWLRVLPDLAKTSLVERISNFNPKKSMTDKIAALSHPARSPLFTFFAVFTAVFLLMLTASVVITFILPKSYASEARLVFLRNISADKRLAQNVAGDPDAIRSELEIFGGYQVLGAVINKLNLNAKWSKRYANGQPLNSGETLNILRHRVVVDEDGKSGMARVRVYDESPTQACSIARAIIQSYLDYREEHHSSDPKKVLNISMIQAPCPGYLARPNKSVNIFCGVIAGGFFGLIIGAASALVSAKLGNRGRKNIAAA